MFKGKKKKTQDALSRMEAIMSQERLPFSASGSRVFSVASSASGGVAPPSVRDDGDDDFGDSGGRTPASPASAMSEALATPAPGHSVPPPVVHNRHSN